jgi:hypothetical protein
VVADSRSQTRIDAPETGDGWSPAAAVEPPIPPLLIRASAPDDAGPPMTTTLLLSLFLLILAFFIALVSMALPSDDRSVWVLRSVAEAFSPSAPPGADRRLPATVTGDALSGLPLSHRLHQLFATELDVAVIQSRQGGRRLVVSVPASAVFQDAAAAVSPTMLALLDDVVIVVGDRPAGVDVAIDVRLSSDGTGADASTLVRQRAGALGAAFTRRGIAPEALSVAIAPETLTVAVAPGTRDGVRMEFVIDQDRLPRTQAPREVPR